MNCRKKSLGIFLILLGIVYNSLIQIACGGEARKDKLIEEAMKEGEVVYYATTSIFTAQSLAKGFESQYPGIKVKMFKMNSELMITRVLAEYINKKYIADIVEVNTSLVTVLKEKGVMGKYVSPESKNLGAGWKDPDGYLVVHYNFPLVWAYNTKLVSSREVPGTLEDLLSTKWKGKLLMNGTQPQWFIGQLDLMGREKGMAYMKRFGEQQIVARTGWTLAAQLIAAGESPLGMTGLLRVEEFKQKGASIDWARISPLITISSGVGVTSHSPHPNAARLFVDFVLSDKGQRIIGETNQMPSRLSTDHPLKKALEGVDLFPLKPISTNEYAQMSKIYRSTLRLH